MELFNAFIQELLDQMNPYDAVTHPRNSVIVLDNCQIHKDPAMLEYIIARYGMLESLIGHIIDTLWDRGMRYVFLPPYSPDYNPIELAFSSMKACFRKNRDLVEDCWTDPRRAQRLLIRVACAVTPEKAAGWFLKCGY